MLILLLLLKQLLLVGLHLSRHLLADLYPFLQIFQHASLIEKQFQGSLQSLAVVWSGGDVHFLLGEDGVFGVHQFVHQDSQRISVICVGLDGGIALEIAMVEIRHIGLFLQLEDKIGIHCDWFTYLGYAVLNVDVFYVQHA